MEEDPPNSSDGVVRVGNDSAVAVSHPAVTISEWKGMPCQNCGVAKEHHFEDSKCPFEASTFKPISFDIEYMGTWIYEVKKMTEPVKHHRPYPETSKYDKRKIQVLERKAKGKKYK